MRKKNVLIILAAVLFLALAGGAAGMFLYYRDLSGKMEDRLHAAWQEAEEFKQQLEAYEVTLTPVWKLVNDVKAGTPVKNYDLELVYVPQESVPENAIQKKALLKGKLYKTALTANTCLTENMIISEEVAADHRELDVVMTEIPIGLEAGDYIDVRITFPLGQDCIAMTKKRVLAIYGNVVKLVVNEEDIYSYESVKTDYGHYRAVRIYGIKYVEAGLQPQAESYYPVNLDVMKTMILDPNMETGDFAETLEFRKQLEEQNLNELVDEMSKVANNKERLDSMFKEAEREYEQLQREKERQLEKETGKNDGSYSSNSGIGNVIN